MGKTKYLFSTGELHRKDNSLVFKDLSNKLNYFPIESIREIYVMNEITINTKLLAILSQFGIILHFFDYHGNYIGTYFPKEQYLSGRLLLKQTEKYKDMRLRIAKSFVDGIGINIEEVIYHYYRHGKDIKHNIDNIRKLRSEALGRVDSIKQILSVEGRIWQEFYDTIPVIIPDEFEFFNRQKCPPDNQINAMISFGNMLLYTKTISSIYQTHLNPTISYLHEPAERRFSLSLDLSEAFKPVIVYRTIFELVNNRKIHAVKHFIKTVNNCILNEDGKKIFITAFEERLNKTINHQKLKRDITYQTLIKLDGYKLIKDIMENQNFIPYSEKERF